MQNKPAACPQVLGQLLQLQAALLALPDNKAVIAGVCRDLTAVPGVAAVSHRQRSRAHIDAADVIVPLAAGAAHHGFLLLRIADAAAFAPYCGYLESFGCVLAVMLEERHQRLLNELQQDQLEERVAERTRQLTLEIHERWAVEESLLESEARFRAVFEQAAVGVAQLETASGRFVRINQRYCDILGYTKEEMLELDFQTVTHPEDLKVDLGHMAELVAGHIREFSMEKRYFRKDGSLIWVALSVAPMWSAGDEPDYHIAVVQDISARKHAEAQVHALNSTLEQRVAERTLKLEHALQELEAFSYSVSHDLRAPLRAINGFATILIDEERERMSSDCRNMLDRIARNATKLGELIDDILEYSRAGRQALDKTAVELEPIVQALANEMAAVYPVAVLKIDDLPLVKGDATMLRMIMQNLLDNACKYSSGSANPLIEVGAFNRGGEAVIFVRDHGAGFDMRYAGKLFGLFQRMHTESQFFGTGVGLAIVRRLVERHGGRVWAEAEVGKGACFFFTLEPCRSAGFSAQISRPAPP